MYMSWFILTLIYMYVILYVNNLQQKYVCLNFAVSCVFIYVMNIYTVLASGYQLLLH